MTTAPTDTPLRSDDMGNVYILVVNWNGWQDTVECLESVFHTDYPGYRVVVCDNGSEDDSLHYIQQWADGKLPCEVRADNPLKRLTEPPAVKPIRWVEYDRAMAERGGQTEREEPPLVLIRTGGNLGFSGGNNVGLRYVLARGLFSYVWLLNNDTVIERDALTRLVERMEERPDAGMCGSCLPFYSAPERIWALGGGTYDPWSGTALNIGYNRPVTEVSPREQVESGMAFVAGASILVRKGFLLDVGLLCEDYFLYFEEPDWSVRGKGRYTLAYAPESVVYHKVAISTSTLDQNATKGGGSKFHMMKSYFLFTRKHYPLLLPIAFCRYAAFRIKRALTKEN